MIYAFFVMYTDTDKKNMVPVCGVHKAEIGRNRLCVFSVTWGESQRSKVKEADCESASH